jgi:hypothetical protein
MRTALSVVFFFCLLSCSNDESANKQNKYIIDSAFTVNVIASKNKPFKHRQIFTEAHKISEPLGSGVASIDIDNDGVYELFFAQFDENHSKSVLYQRQSQQYVNITKQVGLNNLTAIIGVATADINNDGWVDLLVYGVKRLHLMLNNEGHFTELKLPELDENSFFTSATFFNANNDDYLDMWLSRYVEMAEENPIQCLANDGSITYCAPSALSSQGDYLLLNHGGAFFTLALKDSIDIPASPALGVVAADFNNDGLGDIYVANDGVDNFLFIQQKDGRFKQLAGEKSVAANLSGKSEASMGVAIGDYDNNGFIDVFLTHIDKESNTLYKNEGQWFTDVSNTTGLGAVSRVYTGFGTGFYDLNGDNWLDIFVINGRIQLKDYQAETDIHKQFEEQPLLFINAQGKFKNSVNFTDEPLQFVGRGVSFVDLDNDGDVDMVTNNNNQQALIFNNNLNPANWYGLDIKCHNRSDFGARVEYIVSSQAGTQAFYRHIHTDGSYASANDPRIILYEPEHTRIDRVDIEFSNQVHKTLQLPLRANTYTAINCEHLD